MHAHVARLACYVPSNQECYVDKERFDQPRASDCPHIKAHLPGKKERAVLHGFVLLLAENVKVSLLFCPRSVSQTLAFTLEAGGQWSKTETSEKG